MNNESRVVVRAFSDGRPLADVSIVGHVGDDGLAVYVTDGGETDCVWGEYVGDVRARDCAPISLLVDDSPDRLRLSESDELYIAAQWVWAALSSDAQTVYVAVLRGLRRADMMQCFACGSPDFTHVPGCVVTLDEEVGK